MGSLIESVIQMQTLNTNDKPTTLRPYGSLLDVQEQLLPASEVDVQTAVDVP
jgi:hypothetical protein